MHSVLLQLGSHCIAHTLLVVLCRLLCHQPRWWHMASAASPTGLGWCLPPVGSASARQCIAGVQSVEAARRQTVAACSGDEVDGAVNNWFRNSDDNLGRPTNSLGGSGDDAKQTWRCRKRKDKKIAGWMSESAMRWHWAGGLETIQAQPAADYEHSGDDVYVAILCGVEHQVIWFVHGFRPSRHQTRVGRMTDDW